jgi:hypothetical protein
LWGRGTLKVCWVHWVLLHKTDLLYNFANCTCACVVHTISCSCLCRSVGEECM